MLVDTTNLLKVALDPDKNQMEVAKILLMDLASTWWLEEEAKLEKPIT